MGYRTGWKGYDNMADEEIKNTIHKTKKELQNNSLSSLNSRLEPYL